MFPLLNAYEATKDRFQKLVDLVQEKYRQVDQAERTYDLSPLLKRVSTHDPALPSPSLTRLLSATALNLHAVKVTGTDSTNNQEPELSMAHKEDFLLALAHSFMQYGVPAHRLEIQMEQISSHLGVQGTFFVLPALIIVSFGSEGHASRSHIVRAVQGYNVHRLSAVNNLANDLLDGLVTVEQAILLLHQIDSLPVYCEIFKTFLYPFLSFAACMILFGGTEIEAAIGALLSLIVRLGQLLCGKDSRFKPLFAFPCSIFICYFAFVFQGFLYSQSGICLNAVTITLSSILMLLPGISVTVGVMEISTQMMICGTVRLFSALFTSLLLGFGMSLGLAAANDNNAVCQAPESVYLASFPFHFLLLFPIMMLCICMVFEARCRHHFFIMSASICLSYSVNILFGTLTNISNEMIIALAALGIGLASNVYAHFTGDVAIASIMSGLFIIVPGTLGLRASLHFLSTGDTTTGTGFAFQLLMISISITVGLFSSSLLVWPKLQRQRNPTITV